MNKKEKKRIDDIINEYVSNVPEKYYNLRVIKELTNDNFLRFWGISSNAAGKTFNATILFCYLGLKTSAKPNFIVRHYDLMARYIEKMRDKILSSEYAKKYFPKPDHFIFRNRDTYTMMTYEGKQIAIISCLANDGDLKFSSEILSDFPILIFDEFIATDGHYIKREVKKLEIIHRSTDRNHNDKKINTKIIFFANPLNFDSEFLDYYDIYEKLETQKIGEYVEYDDKNVLDLFKNEHVNIEKNNDMFPPVEGDDGSNAEFLINNFLLKPVKKEDKLLACVKLQDEYIVQVYDSAGKDVLKVTSYSPQIDFTLNLKDVTKKIKMLNKKYIRNKNLDDFKKGKYLFANMFTLNYFSKNATSQQINYKKIANKINRDNIKLLEEPLKKEEDYDKFKFAQTLNELYRKFY